LKQNLETFKKLGVALNDKIQSIPQEKASLGMSAQGSLFSGSHAFVELLASEVGLTFFLILPTA